MKDGGNWRGGGREKGRRRKEGGGECWEVLKGRFQRGMHEIIGQV